MEPQNIPQPEQSPISPENSPPHDFHKPLLISIIILFGFTVVLLIVLYVRNTNNKTAENAPISVQVSPTSLPETVSITPSASDEAELNSLDLGNIDQDFTEVETDINQL